MSRSDKPLQMTLNAGNLRSRLPALVMSICSLAITAGCSGEGGSGGGGSGSVKAIAAYCPYLPSRTFTSSATITGYAFYEYRKDGNGEISDSKHVLTATAVVAGSYSLTIGGIAVSTASSTYTAAAGATAVAAAVNAASVPVTATASGSSVTLLPKTANYGQSTTLTALSGLTETSGNQDPRPIRRAEIQVLDSAGTIVQCAETGEDGSFNFQVQSGSTYTVKVMARANNAYNTAYVMNDPTNNEPHFISSTVTGSGTQTLRLIAKASVATLEGGAFNILDQIYNSQNYLRTQTASCSSSASSNYYPDCSPFVTAPVVKVYWKPGFSPGVYQNISGGISYYLNSKMELYILGGLNGDIDREDMDHFDNSVIIHEYGHFIEDQFGKPDSPGGSHSGNAVIDPRLAWGEGWANFFQAAVTGTAIYRDTYGHVGCTGAPSSGHSSCTGVAFNEDLDPNPAGSYSDKPTTAGEGNFREFSVTRLLWDVVKTSGTSKFSEIWTAFNGPSSGMKVVNDKHKAIGRLHKIQQAITGGASWAALRTTELQGGLDDYATPLTTTSCTSTSKAMAIAKIASDDGSFSKSNQFKNNDFYAYTHPGGVLSVSLSWSGASTADLDLYIYKEAYTYGSTSSMAAFSNAETTTTSGAETASATLAAGQYMINVMAYTRNYSSSGTYNTTYNLTVNGSAVCPAP